MRARLAIAASGLVCVLREVVLAHKPPALLLASAKGTVPVLVTADGTVIDQSLDIMHWALQQSDPFDWLNPQTLIEANIWIDLSGWSPKYFPAQLVQYANTLLKDRILFGSDFPLITPDRWLADFEEAGFKDSVKPMILKANAMRLLGLK